jgi:hypothetical protein
MEQVLPRDEAAPALYRERRHLVEQRAQRDLIAGGLSPLAEAVQVVGFLEGGQRMQLEPLAREVLEQDLAAAEADLVARGGVGQFAPVLAIALELEEGDRHARGSEPARQRERFDRIGHVAELRPASPAQLAERADREDVVAPPAAVVGARDLGTAQLAGQCPVDRPAPALAR